MTNQRKGPFGNVFKTIPTVFLEQFLKPIFKCFHEQNFIWQFKYEKMVFWIYHPLKVLCNYV